jgi:SAM-dependent methyltransferase
MDKSLYLKFYEVEQTHWWFQARREILYAVTSQFVAPSSRVLDTGCGTGFFIDKAKERYDVWGIDASPIAVEICHERGLANVVMGSAADLSGVSDRRFEGILLFDVIEHLEDDLAALRHARELLTPNGLIIVTVPAFMFMWSRHDELNHHKRRYVKIQLHNLLRDAGFSIEKLSYFNSYLFPLAVLSRFARRMFGRDGEGEFKIPALRLNQWMKAIFAAEAKKLLNLSPTDSFPFGLSLLAVGRKQDSIQVGESTEKV